MCWLVNQTQPRSSCLEDPGNWNQLAQAVQADPEFKKGRQIRLSWDMVKGRFEVIQNWHLDLPKNQKELKQVQIETDLAVWRNNGWKLQMKTFVERAFKTIPKDLDNIDKVCFIEKYSI